MGPVKYPPASAPSGTQSHPAFNYLREIRARTERFRGGRNEQWMLLLPVSGAMVVLSQDIGLYTDVIARWKSIRIKINILNEELAG